MGSLGRRFAMVSVAALATVAGGTAGQVDAAAPGASPPSSPSRAAAAAHGGPTCGGERPKRPTGGRYRCTFTDNFDRDRINRHKWLAQETSYSGVTTQARGCFVDTPQNLSASGGAVHLTARLLPRWFWCRSPYGGFGSHMTVAALSTRTHFSQAYGRYAFRARFPRTREPGVHSALWLYPRRLRYGRWPHSGEIDVAEWMSGTYHLVYPSVHYAGEITAESSARDCVVRRPWRYHRYAVEWTRTSMRFFYDGRLCFEHAPTPAWPLVAPQPFDKPFNIVLSQGFGSAWNAPTAETPTVATMDVDWVRAWR